jgi:hypothetical protein
MYQMRCSRNRCRCRTRGGPLSRLPWRRDRGARLDRERRLDKIERETTGQGQAGVWGGKDRQAARGKGPCKGQVIGPTTAMTAMAGHGGPGVRASL